MFDYAKDLEPKVDARSPLDTMLLHSIALSMKRIADTLSGEGSSILTQPINAYGEPIGEAIQGQIVRGQRGISLYD